MLITENNILFAFIISLLISYVVVPKIISFSKKYRLADVAGKRASHVGSVPVLGGVAIFIGSLFAMLFCSNLAEIQFIIASIVVVFFVGLVDDLLSLTPYRKLLGQAIAILIVIYFGDIQIDNMHGVLGIYELPEFAATLFTGFVVIVITNGFNLIDGVDGLASGIGIISAFCFGIIAFLMNQMDMAVIAFSLMGSLLSFLKYNLHPARIFMGDTGSLVVGMIFSVLAINLIQSGLVTEIYSLPNKGPLLSIVFLAIPLFDSLRVFVARALQGKGPLSPGRDHIHHALLELGFGHKNTTYILYLLSTLLILFSYFLLECNINDSITLLAIVSYIFLFIPFYFLKRRS